jgi:hypothetical protein
MVEQLTRALMVGLLVAGACGQHGSGEAPERGQTQYRSGDSALISRLVEAHDQLEAGDWRAYLALRGEVALGEHDSDLLAALSLAEPVPVRTAAVTLEDQLVSGGASAALQELARAALEDAISDELTPTLTPLAIRILGRLPRGTSQAALLDALVHQADSATRQMLLAAVGDNADGQGLVELRERFAALESCPEVRHATLAIRRADDAQATAESRGWLATVAAPRVLGCADEAAEAGEAPDAELIALIAAHDQPPGTTLVHEVLLAQVSRALKLRALAMLLESGDASAGAVLSESVKELAAQGLASEVAQIIQALGGF